MQLVNLLLPLRSLDPSVAPKMRKGPLNHQWVSYCVPQSAEYPAHHGIWALSRFIVDHLIGRVDRIEGADVLLEIR